jgi:hypothetical protein
VWCPFTSLCLAADQEGPTGNVISQNPTGGAGAWKSTSIDDIELTGLSCPSRSLCVATDQEGNALIGQPLPTPTRLRALLQRALKPSTLVNHSFVFTAPTAGRLTTTWQSEPQTTGTPGSNAKPTLLANTNTTFADGHTIKIKLTLKRAAKRLLRSARRLTLTAKATFTPKDDPSIVATKRVTLRR